MPLPYLGVFSYKKELNQGSILNFWKLQIIFKSQRKLANVFWFKGHSHYDLVSAVVHKYTRGNCSSSYCGFALDILKNPKEIAICNQLLISNNIPYLDKFDVLAHTHNKIYSWNHSNLAL